MTDPADVTGTSELSAPLAAQAIGADAFDHSHDALRAARIGHCCEQYGIGDHDSVEHVEVDTRA